MSVKASVSITEQQSQFAREMVAQGRYSSISAVVQQGIELLKNQDELHQSELNAFRSFIAERMAGPFVSLEEGKAATEAMLASKRKQYGLAD